jgi:hypothetical protein
MEKGKAPKNDFAAEFFKICGEYCKILEKADKLSQHEFLDNVAVSLMTVYKKTFSVTRFQTKYENEPQKFLSEKQYNKIRNMLKESLGPKDMYPEILDPNRLTGKDIFQASISEDLTDIYQDFYDFTQWFSDGTFESTNDSIIELLNNFDKYWGVKLLNVLRAIHVIRYMKKDASLFKDPLGDDEFDEDNFNEEADNEAMNDFLNEDL